ncbi:glutathione hydrolase-like YwrD proenzyme [Sycon ciliatum]|uniref:glutathione hydrolase-like YwrD proenzyme n=1 Tax=Sycon ciliatum TaxID=27933 RepID=UPI0031F6A13D
MSISFNSRRSACLSRRDCVASSQQLGTKVGLQILKDGGNAADAAVAVAAALNVTEPCSTGIGGDCFCLYYDAAKKQVFGLNGSGRSAESLSLERLESEGYTASNPLPARHAYNATVPGAAAGWVDTIEKFGSGKLTMTDVLQPAVDLADDGVPVAAICAFHWQRGADVLTQDLKENNGGDLLVDGKAPQEGDVVKMPFLADTFRAIQTQGKAGFYSGRIAQALINVVQANGGALTMEDLANHRTTFEDPIHTSYRGIDVWEIAPNGQGLTALMALNILENFQMKEMGHNSVQYIHTLIEALRLSFADTLWYVADPAKQKVPVQELLSKTYAREKSLTISAEKALADCKRGSPANSSDTVVFSVVDSAGNACCFINSNYMGFGTGLVPKDCGFSLQNRGANFSLDPSHPNRLEGGKRPYHTIIPGMATHMGSGELYACFGVMGGFMQPQGHVQVLLNMIDYGMDPQAALDAPRICIGSGYGFTTESDVAMEDGIDEATCQQLKAMGHNIAGPVCGHARALFGRGQIIAPRLAASGERVWWAGSDGRADGMALGN